MIKQTAANNQLLAAIKTIFNDKIFKHASEIMNDAGSARPQEVVCMEYVNQFCRVPYTSDELISTAKSY